MPYGDYLHYLAAAAFAAAMIWFVVLMRRVDEDLARRGIDIAARHRGGDKRFVAMEYVSWFWGPLLLAFVAMIAGTVRP